MPACRCCWPACCLPNWKDGGYLKEVPVDPWGRTYQYLKPGTHGGAYDLYSLGADGKPRDVIQTVPGVGYLFRGADGGVTREEARPR